jgi:hypothetical protein
MKTVAVCCMTDITYAGTLYGLDAGLITVTGAADNNHWAVHQGCIHSGHQVTGRLYCVQWDLKFWGPQRGT